MIQEVRRQVYVKTLGEDCSLKWFCLKVSQRLIRSYFLNHRIFLFIGTFLLTLFYLWLWYSDVEALRWNLLHTVLLQTNLTNNLHMSRDTAGGNLSQDSILIHSESAFQIYVRPLQRLIRSYFPKHCFFLPRGFLRYIDRFMHAPSLTPLINTRDPQSSMPQTPRFSLKYHRGTTCTYIELHLSLQLLLNLQSV